MAMGATEFTDQSLSAVPKLGVVRGLQEAPAKRGGPVQGQLGRLKVRLIPAMKNFAFRRDTVDHED